MHAHPGATKFYYVTEGEGTFTIGDATRTLGPGRLAWSAPDEAHGVENRGNVQPRIARKILNTMTSLGMTYSYRVR